MNNNRSTLVLAPSNNSQLQLLAGDSIYGGNLSINQSFAAPTTLATPFNPAYEARNGNGVLIPGMGNLSADANLAGDSYPLFTFGSPSATGAGNAIAARRVFMRSRATCWRSAVVVAWCSPIAIGVLARLVMRVAVRYG